MKELRDPVTGEPRSDEIDLVQVARRLWKGRKTISILLFFSLATGMGWYTYRRYVDRAEYGASVTLLVESSAVTGDLMMARPEEDEEGRVNLRLVTDSIPADLYPVLIKSTSFIDDLLKIRVKEPAKGDTVPLAGLLSVQIPGTQPLDLLRQGISVETKVPGTLKITVVLPDAGAVKQVADSLAGVLTPFLVTFATQKATANLQYIIRLQADAAAATENALQEIAAFHDRTSTPLLANPALEEKRLQANWQIACDRQLLLSREAERARFRIQAATPSVTVIQPASDPARANLPNLVVTLLVSVFAGLLTGSTLAYYNSAFTKQNS